MKKVLIITYYWPPAGGPGVQRVLKFAKYLPQFGWQPIILTVEKPDAPIYDNSLEKDISSECKVYRSKGFEPFEIYKKFIGKKDQNIPNDVLINKNASLKEKFAIWIRANLFIPDAKIGWYRAAVKKGLEIIKEEKIDLIFSSAPPPTVALIARSLSKKSKIKWVSDFRDPWLEIVYYQSLKRNKITVAIDALLEKKCLLKADKVTTVSKQIAELFYSKIQSKKYVIIPNGFDEDDFSDEKFPKNKLFTIAYTGTISKDRVPYPLLNALSKIKKDGIKIKIKMVGRFSSELYEEIKKLNIEKFFELLDFVPHSESTKILQTSDALLLVVDNVPDNKGFLTGKMFEYLGCKKPVLGIGPLDGDAREILLETSSGEMVDYSDNEGAYKLLIKLYEEWEKDQSSFKFNVMNYSRRRLTEKLVETFEDLTK